MTTPSSSPPVASRAIAMSDAATAGRIEEDYANSAPYQHAIEIVRNAMQQPRTTHVTLDIDTFPSTGALKRIIWNNGPHMPKNLMETYMGSIGEGTGDIWRLDNTLGNRHAGARSSVLPFTDLAVLSWDAVSAPQGLYMKLFKDAKTHEYRCTCVTTPDEATLALLTRHTEVRSSGHGVAFVYLGRDESVDGPFIDPNTNKGESENGLADALRDRLFVTVCTDGTPVAVTVNTVMPANSAGGVGGRKLTGARGKKYRLDGRVIKGHDDWLHRPCEVGSIVVDPTLGIAASFALLPYETDPASRHLPFGGKGHIIIRYKNESMVLAAPGGDYPELGKLMRTFGVQLAEVYNRLSIVLEGPADAGNDPNNPRLHLHQDPSRSRIVMSNGKDIPIDDWGEAFIQNMPIAIVEANRAARERCGSRSTIKISAGDRLMKQLASRLKSIMPSRHRKPGTGVLGHSGQPGTDYLDGMVTVDETLPTGPTTPTGVPGMTPGGSTKKTSPEPTKPGAQRPSAVSPIGSSTRKRREQGSEAATEVRPRPAPIPQPMPMPAAKWAAQGLDPNDFASWDVAAGCVYFNLGHHIFHTQISYFSGEWLSLHPTYARRVSSDDVRDVVHEAYEEETIGRILHYVAANGAARAKDDLSDRNLTIAAHGFENVQDKIESSIRKVAARGGVVTTGTAA